MTSPRLSRGDVVLTRFPFTDKVAAVERTVIVRRLGRLGPQMQAEADRLLRGVLGL